MVTVSSGKRISFCGHTPNILRISSYNIEKNGDQYNNLANFMQWSVDNIHKNKQINQKHKMELKRNIIQFKLVWYMNGCNLLMLPGDPPERNLGI